MNLFERINNAIEGAEGSIITLVTTLIPWLAPALPAYLTYSHLSVDMGIPWFVALLMAAVVEFLGLAAISTAFSAMRHNKQRENRAGYRRVSLAFPIGAYVFYLAVILVTNVLLEWPMNTEARQYSRIAAIALFTLISAPAFVIAVSRNEQHRLASEPKTLPAPERVPEPGGTGAEPERNRSTAAELLRNNPSLTGAELARMLGISASMGRRYKRELTGENETPPEKRTNGAKEHA